jgi:hypothetical protein
VPIRIQTALEKTHPKLRQQRIGTVLTIWDHPHQRGYAYQKDNILSGKTITTSQIGNIGLQQLSGRANTSFDRQTELDVQ